jgi:hypothetical protein
VNPVAHAVRVGLRRGWTEFVLSLRSGQDQGCYAFVGLGVLACPWINRTGEVELLFADAVRLGPADWLLLVAVVLVGMLAALPIRPGARVPRPEHQRMATYGFGGVPWSGVGSWSWP